MLYAFSGLFFTFLWIVLDQSSRRTRGLPPTGMRSLYRWAQRKTTPDPRISPAVFATGCTFIFSFWESGVRFFLSRQPSAWIYALGVAASVFTLLMRARSFRATESPGQVTRQEIMALLVSWALVMGVFAPLILAPWVLWRTLWLPATQLFAESP